MTNEIQITPPRTPEDRAWLTSLWLSEWGGETMVSKGKIYHVSDVSAFMALDGSKRIGAATYFLSADECELLSINAVVKNLGTGTALLSVVENTARQSGARRVFLITSNDNLDALRFYQRRGYRIVAVYKGAVDNARRLKPTIPSIGYYGIPIHDEVELEKRL